MVTIGSKVSEEFKEKVREYAENRGKTASLFMKECIEREVFGVNHNEREVNHNADDGEYGRLGFDAVLRNLRSRGYPDEEIVRFNEQLVHQIRDGGMYRRSRAEWGA